MTQFQQPGFPGHTESVGDVTGNRPPSPPTSMDPSDHLSPVREEALQLLKRGGDRAHVIWFTAGALVLGFGLGWASNSSWSSAPIAVASNPTVQNDPPYRRSDVKSANRVESSRKQPTLGAGTNNSPKPLSTGSVPRPEGESSRMAAAALAADNSLPTGSIPTREPGFPIPETRPTTIAGWIVREVRGGTAVLEGPDGTWTGAAGDTVPGVGRIDSIVRWGNRWIVATANGLIATP
jgi:hypothetical protein